MSQAERDQEKRRQLYAIAIVAIIALLGINIYLFMSGRSKDEVIVQQQEEINKADSLNKELEADYQAAMQELEAKAVENEEMREVIEQQKQNLTAMRDKIKGNIDKGVKSESALKEAKQQIALLTSQKVTYLQQIEQLQADNADLSAAKIQLESEKVSLVETIKVKDETIAGVESAKAKVETDKAKVEEQNKELENKVDRGGVLTVHNIKAQALRFRNSGAEKEVSRAKQVEKFKVCFDVHQNDLTKPGANKFHLRIIDPIGQTISVESSGSGTFVNKTSGGDAKFTVSKSFDYKNDSPNICMEWIQNNVLNSGGEYTFELYNRGYLSGTTKIELK
jgi:hypothetical protein